MSSDMSSDLSSDMSYSISQSMSSNILQGVFSSVSQPITFKVDNYDLEKTLTSGQVFRYQRKQGIIPKTFTVYSKNLYCNVSQSNTSELILNSFTGDIVYWKHYFNIDYDYASFENLMQSNPILSAAFDCAKGIRLLQQDPWETLISFLVSPQKRIPQIQQCIESICNVCCEPRTPYRPAFPTSDQIKPELLQDCKLGYRWQSIASIVQNTQKGNFDVYKLTSDKMDFYTAMSNLMRNYGVGEKVASCVCLFGLGYTRAFPIDIHIKRILELMKPYNFDQYEFGAQAGLCQQYLFYYAITHNI